MTIMFQRWFYFCLLALPPVIYLHATVDFLYINHWTNEITSIEESDLFAWYQPIGYSSVGENEQAWIDAQKSGYTYAYFPQIRDRFCALRDFN